MKFAYLIMAHHRFDVLKELLRDIDDERNDIFIHIDKKTKNPPLKELESCVSKGRIIFLNRIRVYWGHSSQVKCVLKLLESALEYGYHDYYHLLVGVEFPLKDQDEIYAFFEKNKGKEFIGYDNNDKAYPDRIRYYYFGWKYCRSRCKIEKALFSVGKKAVELQKRIGFDRIKNDCVEYKKGYANWSITNGLAQYIIDNRRFIETKVVFTYCADEILIHTLVFGSPFKEYIFDMKDEYNSAQRLTTWDNKLNRITIDNIGDVIRTDRLFIRKIDGQDALKVIKIIKENRHDKNNGNLRYAAGSNKNVPAGT